MSAVAERTEEEQLLESWLDGEVECHWHDCDAPARWRALLQCKHSFVYCSQHRRAASPAAGVKHIRCSVDQIATLTTDVRWTEL